MKIKISFVGLLALLLFCSCDWGQGGGGVEFTRKLYSPEYAGGFEILGCDEGESSLLRITRPWQGESVENFELLILRGGQQPPVDFKGAVIRGEAERIVALSSSNVAMFDRIGEVNRIVGVSGLDYITSTNIAKRALQKNVCDVGYDTALNYELLMSLHPDIVLLYSVAGRNTSVTGKLDELKIPYIYVGDYAEESPLGKAEWMVAMGEICGQRERAESLFAQSAQKYCELAAQCSDPASDKPLVMLNTPYRDIWYMPSRRSYMVRLIEDAGGRYIYESNETSQTQPISLEEAYKLATAADIWLNTGATINSMAELTAQVPKFTSMEVVRQGRVYNNTARRTPKGGSDFWESGVVYPEVVLRDLIKIINPSHPSVQGDELYYYQKLE